MKGKKGQVFEVMIVVITLVVCGYAVSTFFERADSVETLSSPAVLRDIYAESKSLEYYLKDYANLASQSAYAKMAEKPAYGASCGVGEYAFWDSLCPDENSLKEEFKNEVKALITKNYNANLEYSGNNLNIKYDEITLKRQGKNYYANYTTKPEFEIAYNIDFRKIADISIAKKAECSQKYADMAGITGCLKGISINGWNADVSGKANYYLFNLTSKKYYFYSDSFRPIELKFALKQ